MVLAKNFLLQVSLKSTELFAFRLNNRFVWNACETRDDASDVVDRDDWAILFARFYHRLFDATLFCEQALFIFQRFGSIGKRAAINGVFLGFA